MRPALKSQSKKKVHLSLYRASAIKLCINIQESSQFLTHLKFILFMFMWRMSAKSSYSKKIH